MAHDDKVDPFLILSTGRALTSFLHQLFVHVKPAIHVEHQMRGSRVLNVAGNILIEVSDNEKAAIHLIRLFRVFRQGRMPAYSVDPLLSIPFTIFLSKKTNCSKNIKIVHLVRDPRNFVSSFMNWKQQKLRRWILHHAVPCWQPTPLLSEKKGFMKRLGMDKFEHFCWIWNYKNTLFRDRFLNDNDRYYFARMEDLVDLEDGYKNISNMMKFIGVTVPKCIIEDRMRGKINRSTDTYFSDWRYWQPARAKTLDQYCGDLMRIFGYGDEVEWRKLLEQ